jgi:hypothetical protein
MAKKSTRKRRSPSATSSRPARRRAAPRRRPASAAAPAAPDAQMVFRGTVLQHGAATMAEVPASESTVVVRVDEILHGSDVVRDFEGQPITVQLGEGQTLADGAEYIFHADGWLFGASIAVVAVAVEPASGVATERRRAAISARPAQAVKARASRAEMVVSGQVTQITRVPRPPGAPISEHEPEWQEAVVQVEHVAQAPRGRRPGSVTIRFAASRDVRWARAPKFSVGQEGLWMLGDKTKEGTALRVAAAVPKDQYLVVEPEDFYPKESALRVLSQIE